MFDLTTPEPDVPRPDNTTVTFDPLVSPLITQLVAVTFLQDPLDDFTDIDLTEPRESFAFHFTLTMPAALEDTVGVMTSLPVVILPLAAIRKRP
jgi:hypothetical protein